MQQHCCDQGRNIENHVSCGARASFLGRDAGRPRTVEPIRSPMARLNAHICRCAGAFAEVRAQGCKDGAVATAGDWRPHSAAAGTGTTGLAQLGGHRLGRTESTCLLRP
jgi:hypothetical protein